MLVEAVPGAAAEAFAAELRPIYEESFPAEQRGPWEALLDSIGSSERELRIARQDGATIGFAITVPLTRVAACLLEFLAVASAERDRGAGGALLDRLVEDLRGDAATRRLLIEVDDEDIPHRDRLLPFYDRHGARHVECAPHYRTPSTTDERLLDMRLLEIPVADVEPAAGAELRSLLVELLVRAYNVGEDHPAVAANLEALAC